MGASRWISGAIPFGARAGGESTSASGDASARARATATGGAAATAIGERETDLARARRARRAVGRGRGRGRRYGHRCGEGSARGVFFAVAMGGRDASAPRRNGEKRDEKLLCRRHNLNFLGKKFQFTRAAGRWMNSTRFCVKNAFAPTTSRYVHPRWRLFSPLCLPLPSARHTSPRDSRGRTCKPTRTSTRGLVSPPVLPPGAFVRLAVAPRVLCPVFVERRIPTHGEKPFACVAAHASRP